MTYHIYLHVKPAGRLEDTFYVGKGDDARIKLIPRRNKHHANIVKKYGRDNIVVKSLPCESEAHALKLEMEVISVLRRLGIKLCNQTDGGEGASGYRHSAEVKAKFSATRTGRKNSPETIAKRAASITGRLVTAATRDKLANSARGRITPRNKSGHVGVRKEPKGPSWRASISVSYLSIHLGSFSTMEGAIEARKAGELKYWGATV